MTDYAAEDAAYDAAVKAEWGMWVANGPVYIGGALAFTDGAPVPASTVERFDLVAGGYVRKATEPKPESVSVSSAPPRGEDIVLASSGGEASPPEPVEPVEHPADLSLDPPDTTKK